MTMATGDPELLRRGATLLSGTAEDLLHDATGLARVAHGLGAAAPGRIGDLLETAVAALGGAVSGAATIVSGLSEGATVAADQLDRATGGS